MGRQGGRYKQLLDDLNEMRGCWKLKQDVLDRTLLRTMYGTTQAHKILANVIWRILLLQTGPF
jgi:hypothetical protein